MRGLISRGAVPALILALLPSLAGAQSMTVIGGDSFARECYMAATIAAQMNSASRDDVETCGLAIDHGNLSMRDLMATYVNRGVVYVALEEYKKAVKDYATALSMNPQSGEVYVNRGNLYFMGQVFDKAVEEYTLALDLGLAKDHIAHFNRGMAYEHLGDYSNAESDYRRAAELVPEWHQPPARLDRLHRKIRKQETGN
ncbi:MAG: tetratricopeptide repeat protein [Gammaproteobacteria bacterium]|nr:tetratricopeptide repeat protein [Gammaproteobacteria bacterium]